MRYEKEKLALWLGTPIEHMLFNVMEILEKVCELMQSQQQPLPFEATAAEIPNAQAEAESTIAPEHVEVKKRSRKKVS